MIFSMNISSNRNTDFITGFYKKIYKSSKNLFRCYKFQALIRQKSEMSTDFWTFILNK